MINRKRMVKNFVEFVRIASPSKKEEKFAKHIKKIFDKLGLKPYFDNAGKAINGDCGNLVARFKGNRTVPSILFCAHFDTVEPSSGINPQIKNGIISQKGETILGADDKSAIAEIIEMLRVIKENDLPSGDIEILITVAEEPGLLGAKNFNTKLLKSRFGYVLDTEGSNRVVIKAPAAKKLLFNIYGKESHAGLAPEQGISAIKIAGIALAKMRLGRIDHETTANIGIIQGGVAVNIIPNLVVMKGEARSHDIRKLKNQVAHMRQCVLDAVKGIKICVGNKKFTAGAKIEIKDDYPKMELSENSKSVKLIMEAGRRLGKDLHCVAAGGGSDANILNNKGIEMPIVSCGMQKVHSKDEFIKIDDMVKTTELLLAIISANTQAV
jgi:tripeptide aminopeptidase